MGNINRGKQFEEVVRKAFEKVNNTYVLRLHDQTNGYLGSNNPCDFIVYKYPNIIGVECKSIHGNVLPLNNITKNQIEGLKKLSEISGAYAGVICWWIDRDVTKFIPIQTILHEKHLGAKSIRFDGKEYASILISGKKKRVFFDYDMSVFFNDLGE